MISHHKLVAHILNAGFIVFFALGCVVLATSEGAADTTDSLRAFQKNQLPSQQEINTSYTKFAYTPFKRNDLAFNLLMPKDWRDIPVSVPAEMIAQDTRRMIPVAEQRAPGKGNDDASIQVAYTRLPMEMSLHDLIDQYLKENEIDVLIRRQGTYNQRKIDEVLIRSEKDSVPFFSRLTFSRHGDRIFVVSGSAHESQFSRYHPSFAIAAVSFMVQQKAASPYAVKMVPFTSSRTPTLKFNYPEEWEIEELQHLPDGQTGVDLKLIVHGEKPQAVTTYGYIHVRGVSKNTAGTPQRILENLKKNFENMSISYQQCALKADVMPNQPDPLWKLEKWDVVAGGVPGQTAFCVLPHRSDVLALGLFCMRPEDNLVSWQHVWRVFEIVANDLTGKDLALSKVKSLDLPSSRELTHLTAATMTGFATAAQKQDFHVFHAGLSTPLQLQATPQKLLQAFRGFGKLNELAALNQLDPVLETEICLDKDGLLKLIGHYPTQPQATTFKLTYVNEQAGWKLLSIHVAMKKTP